MQRKRIRKKQLKKGGGKEELHRRRIGGGQHRGSFRMKPETETIKTKKTRHHGQLQGRGLQIRTRDLPGRGLGEKLGFLQELICKYKNQAFRSPAAKAEKHRQKERFKSV